MKGQGRAASTTDGQRRPVVPLVRSIALVALGGGLVAFVLPRASGASWTAILAALAGLAPHWLLLLAALWLVGLWAHSFVLTSSLPGLSRTRALTLNLTGSAVSNVLPMGGAFGVGLNFAMVRGWGFGPAPFALFTLVSNLWDVAAKLVLPVAAMVALVAVGGPVDPRVLAGAVVVAAAAMALLAVGTSALSTDGGARALGRAVQGVLDRVVPAASGGGGAVPRWDVEGLLADVRARASGLLRQGWPRMAGGMAGYLALQALLLWACLHALGAVLGPAALLAAFAVERLTTLAVVTPGGTGLSEAAAAAMLVTFGVPPAVAGAGVLLYRGFTFLLEIPVGGAGIVAWLLMRRLARRVATDSTAAHAPVAALTTARGVAR
jgi:hypothetical protein